MNDMEPEEAYARFVLRKLSSEEMVSLADAWLNKGMFTESLNQLCWVTDAVFSEVAHLFEKTMQELGIEQPDRLDAADLLIRETLERVVQTELQPVEGAEFIYWDVYREVSNEQPDEKYVGDCLGLEHIFCWLREIWDCRDGSLFFYYSDLPRSEAEAKLKQHLIDESRNWLERDHN